MYSRSFGLTLLAALLLSSTVTGCKKSADSTEQSPASAPSQNPVQTSPPLDTIARVHWLGIKRLGVETNAAYFMSIWNLPETARLEAQTLDKLALWLAQGTRDGSNEPGTGSQDASPNAAQPGDSTGAQIKNQKSKIKNSLLPLLEDLVNRESYLEIHSETNQPAELVLAIRLDPARSFLWQTNLEAAMESLTGAHTVPNSAPEAGWRLALGTGDQQIATSNHTSGAIIQPLTLNVQSCGSWTLLDLAQDQNSTLMADLRDRITRSGSPLAAPATNFWFEAQLDLARISSAFSLNWHLPENFPKTALSILGDGQNVRTRALFDFPYPLPLELEPWNFPTNLIHDPLIGFTAVRGFRPWLDSFKSWNELQAGATPNQAYLWGQEGIPAQEYCAAPFPHAAEVVDRLSDRLQKVVNPWLQTERLGQLQKPTNSNGIAWTGAPFLSPILRSVVDAPGEFALLGLIPLTRTNLPPPPELLREISSRTNLLCYDWEITARGLDHWLYLVQLTRFLSHKAQLPTDSTSFLWVQAVAPKLGNCVTLLSEDQPTQLQLVRKSSFGLSSIDLHLLADWLESPRFPHGLHTFLAAPPPGRTPPANTNSAPKTATLK